MARLTKMSCSETEPKSNWAAKSAFKFYSISSVFRTISLSETSPLSNTWSANQIFFFEISLLFLISAISHSTKVWLITSEACIEWHPGKCILWKVIKIIIIGVSQSGIFVKTLNFGSFYCFLGHLFLKYSWLLEFGFESTAILCFDFPFAWRTIHKGKPNSRAVPLCLDFAHHTLQMKNVLALKNNAGTLSKTICVTNRAVVICFLFHCRFLI